MELKVHHLRDEIFVEKGLDVSFSEHAVGI